VNVASQSPALSEFFAACASGQPASISSLAEFLAACADSLIAEPAHEHARYSSEFTRARDEFVRAGIEALTAPPWESGNVWLQLGIRPLGDLRLRGELCREIAILARRLLSDAAIDEFFFMHKPPGMRLRFQCGAGRSEDVANTLYAEAARWNADGLIDYVGSGIYEPESQLFGGPRSMRFVHALFTVDSLIWLDYHACRVVDSDEISPAWLVSLALLHTVFTGLDISGWEDIGVWDRIRAKAGRGLAQDALSLPLYSEVAVEIREVWSRRDQIVESLHPAVQAIVTQHAPALLSGAAHWRSGYFSQRTASVGPRDAAAFYVVFTWNRAALSATEQALLAESLAQRMA
jgi:thiopeptide-type bacteriocin biosynthesis protein